MLDYGIIYAIIEEMLTLCFDFFEDTVNQTVDNELSTEIAQLQGTLK